MKKFFKNHKALCIVLLFDIIVFTLLGLILCLPPPAPTPCPEGVFCYIQDMRVTMMENIRCLLYVISLLVILIAPFFAIKKTFRKFCLNLTLAFFINTITFVVGMEILINYYEFQENEIQFDDTL